MKRRAQLLHGGHVQGVEDFRPIHGHVSDRVFLFQKYVFEGHNAKSAAELKSSSTSFPPHHHFHVILAQSATDATLRPHPVGEYFPAPGTLPFRKPPRPR